MPTAFASPPLPSRPDTRRAQPVPLCTHPPPRTGRRSRSLTSLTRLVRDAPQDAAGLPEAFIKQVKRLIRSRTFIRNISETLGCPCIRFTGLVFQRVRVTDESADGVPQHMRALQRRADAHFIDVPPGILQRAAERARTKLEVTKIRLCAVFESYGLEEKQLDFEMKQKRIFEKDLETQLLAWSDVGHSMRTETDLTDLNGAELFHERYLDYLD